MKEDESFPLSDCVICPECFALCPFSSSLTAQQCRHCKEDIGWLTGLRDFQDVLSSRIDVDSVRLCIRAVWPGDKSERMSQPPGRLELDAGPAGILQVEWSTAATTVHVQRTEPTPPISLSLPGEMPLEGVKIIAWLIVQPPPQLTIPKIDKLSREPVSLNVGKVVRLGSRTGGHEMQEELDDAAVSLNHALVACQPQTTRYWLVDCRSKTGTFVNHKLIVVRQLEAGDLVQIGPFAWIFSQEDGFLIPVTGIKGVGVELHGVGVDGRLDELDLSIPAGEMIAITGQSGAGKSTMVDTILKGQDGRDRGQVLVGGYDTDLGRESYRRLVAYVSQKEVVHPELTAKQAVDFSARLREVPVDALQVERMLRQVDLPEGTWNKIPENRSGGESKRVRIAAELIAEPRLLVLDEPGSGLDRDREASLMRLLRSLKYRGCTVMVVTYNLQHLDDFDRVLIFRQRALQFYGTPAALCSKIPSGNLADLDLGRIEQRVEERPTAKRPSKAPQQRSKVDVRERLRRLRRQALVLLQREWALLRNFPRKRLLVPVVIVPTFFALSLHLAIKPGDSYLMGFLAIISCIWMGSSLSLMSIVNEREVLEHERLLFLRLVPYVASKTVILWLLSTVQTAVFLLLLMVVLPMVLPLGSNEPPLYGTIWVTPILILVGYASVSMGLAISAFAGHNKPMANFLLPLLMMLQIVFSVQIAGQGEAPLEEAYGEFHYGHVIKKGPRASYWIPKRGWVGPKYGDGPFGEKLDDAEILYENRQRPNLGAARISYFTLSRYADILLRSFAYQQSDFDAFNGDKTRVAKSARKRHKRFGYCHWRWEAISVLFIFVLGGPIATIFMLAYQEPCARRFSKLLAALKNSRNENLLTVLRRQGRVGTS